MASSSKKKTTMAKLMREQRLRERRVMKQARKDARKHAAAEGRDGDDDALQAPADVSTPASSTLAEEPAPTDELVPTSSTSD